jgi:DNA-binding NtrC family response regulator
MIIIEETTDDLATDKEQLWIKRFGLSELTNHQCQPDRPAKTNAKPSSPNESKTLRSLGAAERDVILSTLQQCNGNKLETTKRLGIGRQTLYNKLSQFKQDKPGETSFL